MLLSDRSIQVDTQDMDGWTALMWACEYKYFDIVKQLLKKKADVLLRDGVNILQPIIIAKNITCFLLSESNHFPLCL